MKDQRPNQSPLTRQGMDYGETADVHEVHAAIQREKREPRVGLEPLSIWLIAVYGLAIFAGGAYLGRSSGNFSGDNKLSFHRAIAAKKFLRQIVRLVIKQQAKAFPDNIRRSPDLNLPRAVRVAPR